MSSVYEDHVVRQDPGGFVTALGLTITAVSPQQVTGNLDVGPQHHQPFGIVHGGVYAAIVETLASFGAAATVADRGDLVVGVHNATDFLRAHRTGRLVAAATPVHQGRTQQLWQVEVVRESDGKVVARGQVRLAVVPAERMAPDRGPEDEG